jgi:hypothetical protein
MVMTSVEVLHILNIVYVSSLMTLFILSKSFEIFISSEHIVIVYKFNNIVCL